MFNIIYNSTIAEKTQRNIEKYLHECEALASQYFQLTRKIDLYFFADEACMNDSKNVLPAETFETGLIIFDVCQQNFSKKKFLQTMIHELNHARGDEIFSTEAHPTLFNWTLAEGLAETFVLQVANDHGFEWTLDYDLASFSEKQLFEGMREILAIGESNDWDHYSWFYNFDKAVSYPENYAYAIGFFLVQKYCEKYAILPSEALSVPNQKFLEFAKVLVGENDA